MADLLKLAREKSERLISEAEETSALIESAEYFFREITKHRALISKEIGDLDDFLSDANSIMDCIKRQANKNIEEVKKIEEFIRVGEMLLGQGMDSESEQRVEKRGAANAVPGGDQLHWLTFNLKKRDERGEGDD